MDLQVIHNKIYEVRGQRVMLDFDLAILYEVTTGALNQAVKRNPERFPSDFMFQTDNKELTSLRSQFVIANIAKSRSLPFAFTEQGVAMLSSVLRSPRAIEVNISIMRAFVEMRRLVMGYEELRQRIEQLEAETDAQFSEVYQALTTLLTRKDEEKTRGKIGFVK